MTGALSARALRVLDHEFSAAVGICAGVVAALAWSALSGPTYQHVMNATWSGPVANSLDITSLHSLISSGLITIFFFVVGLELARELQSKAFASSRDVVAPILGAIGGMAATALLAIGVGVVVNSAPLRRGWGIPMATDIAFTLGLLAVAGRHLPSQLRLFLLTLAIADDVFSIAVLSVTGVLHVRTSGLGAVVVALVSLGWASRRRTGIAWRLIVLVVLWVALAWARVEPPLAGVLAGLVVPFDHHALHLERQVRRTSVGVILPVFALASCGVAWSTLSLHRPVVTIVIATIGIRIVGKVVGITGGVALARRLHYQLHPSLTMPLLAAASVLCAIGLTVPLLFAGVLFAPTSSTYGAFTIGLLLTSLLATVGGVALIRAQSHRH